MSETPNSGGKVMIHLHLTSAFYSEGLRYFVASEHSSGVRYIVRQKFCPDARVGDSISIAPHLVTGV